MSLTSIENPCGCAGRRCDLTADSPLHGRHGGYGAHGCRCDRCREFKARYQREYRWRRGGQPFKPGELADLVPDPDEAHAIRQRVRQRAYRRLARRFPGSWARIFAEEMAGERERLQAGRCLVCKVELTADDDAGLCRPCEQSA